MGATVSVKHLNKLPELIDRDTFKQFATKYQFTNESYDHFIDRDGKISRNRMLEIASSYDCYCSFEWGIDGNGKSVHKRVQAITKYLQSKGLIVHIEDGSASNPMLTTKGINLQDRIETTLKHSQCMLLFFTERYFQKFVETANNLINNTNKPLNAINTSSSNLNASSSTPKNNSNTTNNTNDIMINQLQMEFYLFLQLKTSRFILPIILEENARIEESNNMIIPIKLYDMFHYRLCFDMIDFEHKPEDLDNLYYHIIKLIQPLRQGGAFKRISNEYQTSKPGIFYHWLKKIFGSNSLSSSNSLIPGVLTPQLSSSSLPITTTNTTNISGTSQSIFPIILTHDQLTTLTNQLIELGFETPIQMLSSLQCNESMFLNKNISIGIIHKMRDVLLSETKENFDYIKQRDITKLLSNKQESITQLHVRRKTQAMIELEQSQQHIELQMMAQEDELSFNLRHIYQLQHKLSAQQTSQTTFLQHIYETNQTFVEKQQLLLQQYKDHQDAQQDIKLQHKLTKILSATEAELPHLINTYYNLYQDLLNHLIMSSQNTPSKETTTNSNATMTTTPNTPALLAKNNPQILPYSSPLTKSPSLIRYDSTLQGLNSMLLPDVTEEEPSLKETSNNQPFQADNQPNQTINQTTSEGNNGIEDSDNVQGNKERLSLDNPTTPLPNTTIDNANNSSSNTNKVEDEMLSDHIITNIQESVYLLARIDQLCLNSITNTTLCIQKNLHYYILQYLAQIYQYHIHFTSMISYPEQCLVTLHRLLMYTMDYQTGISHSLLFLYNRNGMIELIFDILRYYYGLQHQYTEDNTSSEDIEHLIMLCVQILQLCLYNLLPINHMKNKSSSSSSVFSKQGSQSNGLSSPSKDYSSNNNDNRDSIQLSNTMYKGKLEEKLLYTCFFQRSSAMNMLPMMIKSSFSSSSSSMYQLIMLMNVFEKQYQWIDTYIHEELMNKNKLISLSSSGTSSPINRPSSPIQILSNNTISLAQLEDKMGILIYILALYVRIVVYASHYCPTILNQPASSPVASPRALQSRKTSKLMSSTNSTNNNTTATATTASLNATSRRTSSNSTASFFCQSLPQGKASQVLEDFFDNDNNNNNSNVLTKELLNQGLSQTRYSFVSKIINFIFCPNFDLMELHIPQLKPLSSYSLFISITQTYAFFESIEKLYYTNEYRYFPLSMHYTAINKQPIVSQPFASRDIRKEMITLIYENKLLLTMMDILERNMPLSSFGHMHDQIKLPRLERGNSKASLSLQIDSNVAMKSLHPSVHPSVHPSSHSSALPSVLPSVHQSAHANTNNNNNSTMHSPLSSPTSPRSAAKKDSNNNNNMYQRDYDLLILQVLRTIGNMIFNRNDLKKQLITETKFISFCLHILSYGTKIMRLSQPAFRNFGIRVITETLLTISNLITVFEQGVWTPIVWDAVNDLIPKGFGELLMVVMENIRLDKTMEYALFVCLTKLLQHGHYLTTERMVSLGLCEKVCSYLSLYTKSTNNIMPLSLYLLTCQLLISLCQSDPIRINASQRLIDKSPIHEWITLHMQQLCLSCSSGGHWSHFYSASIINHRNPQNCHETNQKLCLSCMKSCELVYCLISHPTKGNEVKQKLEKLGFGNLLLKPPMINPKDSLLTSISHSTEEAMGGSPRNNKASHSFLYDLSEFSLIPPMLYYDPQGNTTLNNNNNLNNKNNLSPLKGSSGSNTPASTGDRSNSPSTMLLTHEDFNMSSTYTMLKLDQLPIVYDRNIEYVYNITKHEFDDFMMNLFHSFNVSYGAITNNTTANTTNNNTNNNTNNTTNANNHSFFPSLTSLLDQTHLHSTSNNTNNNNNNANNTSTSANHRWL